MPDCGNTGNQFEVILDKHLHLSMQQLCYCLRMRAVVVSAVFKAHLCQYWLKAQSE